MLDGLVYSMSYEALGQTCGLLGFGHEALTEERTRIHDAGGGILVDGPPQNSSSAE